MSRSARIPGFATCAFLLLASGAQAFLGFGKLPSDEPLFPAVADICTQNLGSIDDYVAALDDQGWKVRSVEDLDPAHWVAIDVRSVIAAEQAGIPGDGRDPYLATNRERIAAAPSQILKILVREESTGDQVMLLSSPVQGRVTCSAASLFSRESPWFERFRQERQMRREFFDPAGTGTTVVNDQILAPEFRGAAPGSMIGVAVGRILPDRIEGVSADLRHDVILEVNSTFRQ
ncbi:MAG: hypothetical protein RLO38_15630 [Roseovarius confluentis]